MIKTVLLSVFLLFGCSSQLIPQTPNQFETVTYSQVEVLAKDTKAAYESGAITLEQKNVIRGKLVRVLELMGDASGLATAATLLGEIVEILK